jgi:hypothetical protein
MEPCRSFAVLWRQAHFEQHAHVGERCES